MRDVVIIGGGLSGLSAAWELTKLKIPYTLIEVKRRFGGSIISDTKDGFVMDGGTMLVSRHADWSFLAELRLQEALIPVDDERAVFRQGTQMLTDALAKQLSAPAMMRMAVSSLGTIDESVFGVCLENGILLDTKALIVAAPARYAEKMMRELQGDIALCLLDLRYESIARLSLGYARDDLPPLPIAPDTPIQFIHTLKNSERAPSGSILIQAGLRFDVNKQKPQDILAAFIESMGWEAPLVSRVDYWAEADIIRDAQYAEHIAAIQPLMPAGTALIGSDYLPEDSVNARVEQGRAAARQIAVWLGKSAI